MLAQIFAGVLKQGGNSVVALQSFDENVGSKREENVLGAVGDGLVGIVGKDGEDFDAIDRRDVSAGGANGDFTFPGSPAMPEFIKNFRAESFH
jgi:hypothetical protein